MIDGLLTVLGFDYLLYVVIGVLVGILVGSLPGFTATMGTALVLPFTFTLSPGVGLGMLGALYVAAMYSDAIPACLVNTPGTPSAMTTAFDGYPMTRRGEGQKALVAGAFSSMVGAAVGGFMFLFLAPPLATAALRFGPPEFFWVGIFALTIIGSIAGDSLLKGIAGGFLGMLISTIGLSTTGAVTRYTFGIQGLRGGVSLVAALIAIFALPQVLTLVASRREESSIATIAKEKGVTLAAVREIVARPVNLVRSSVLGGVIGIIPGAGSPVASLVAYNEAIRWSKDKRSFGKGSIHGVVASETANSSAAGGSLVPLIALGVPGSAPAAIIMGALLLQGIQPGPTMFATQPDLVYGFAWSVIIAGVVTFAIGTVMSRGLARMVSIPVPLLVPIIVLLSVIGSYAIRNNLMDVYVMVALGVVVYFLTKIGFHPGPIGLGLILGPIVEPALVQSIALTRASSVTEVFFTRPLSIALIVLSVLSAAWAVRSNYQAARTRPEPDVERLEASEGKAVSESVLGGLAVLAIATVFYLNSGTELRDWVLPLFLCACLAFLALIMFVRAFVGRGGRPVPVTPALLRGKGHDVTVMIGALVLWAVAIRPVGFWLTSTVAVFAISVYLTNERSRRSLLISAAVALGVIGVLYFFMLEVFYVPFPRSTWLPWV